ncbi:NlpC/P60 family putative phage cell wall peptidase [Tepidamorphus gemmatus]|uniref:NlpC/P60 family putative phage cell wall peptidase n=1 Tax=Tepidamorphus gemmatus TaxID=747076 RepID=A0A4R3LQH7_9HYPH|nr:NlpC/P60 family protein [Tepidamorphus gemmatus]TCT02501.1 NlpC/P60 family putative phage cell wall peptidase [Tepidamorphus gemmatus]
MAAASSTDAATVTRAAIVAEARTWLGTPYRHQASMKGAGCDCFGLVRGVWRAMIGPEPDEVPAYSRDWGSVQGTETLLATARRHLIETDPGALAPGDVVVFRIRRGMIARHVGIVSEAAPARFIHAQEHAPVAEVALSDWWRQRIVAAFAFPGL